jgi:hypothetical protein
VEVGVIIESWRSALEPQISWTNPREDCGWIDTVPCGNDIFVGVEVRTEGREDSRKMYGVSVSGFEGVNVKRR